MGGHPFLATKRITQASVEKTENDPIFLLIHLLHSNNTIIEQNI